MKIYNTGLQYSSVPLTFSADNTTINVVKAGIQNQSWFITYFNSRVSGGNVAHSTDVNMRIQNGTEDIYQSGIAKSSSKGASLSVEFPNPIKLTMGNSLTLSIGASGVSGTKITANIGLFQK